MTNQIGFTQHRDWPWPERGLIQVSFCITAITLIVIRAATAGSLPRAWTERGKRHGPENAWPSISQQKTPATSENWRMPSAMSLGKARGMSIRTGNGLPDEQPNPWNNSHERFPNAHDGRRVSDEIPRRRLALFGTKRKQCCPVLRFRLSLRLANDQFSPQTTGGCHLAGLVPHNPKATLNQWRGTSTSPSQTSAGQPVP